MEALNNFELGILNAIQGIKCPFMDVVASAFSFLCEGGWLWIAIAVLLLFFKKYRKNGLVIGAGLVLNLIICNLILKNAVARTRPYDMQNAMYTQDQLLYLARKLHDYSFPSGHTAASFVGAIGLTYANKKWAIPAFAVTILVSLSRLYLYVHYPLDLVGGALSGTFSILLVIFIYKKFILPRLNKNAELKNN